MLMKTVDLSRLSKVLCFGGDGAGGLLTLLDRLFIDILRISSNTSSVMITIGPRITLSSEFYQVNVSVSTTMACQQ